MMRKSKSPLASCPAMHRRLVVGVAVLALVAGACSGGGGKKVDATVKRTTTTAEAYHDPDLTVDETTTSIAGSGTTVRGATATTTKGKGTSGTTSPGASPAPTADPNAV